MNSSKFKKSFDLAPKFFLPMNSVRCSDVVVTPFIFDKNGDSYEYIGSYIFVNDQILNHKLNKIKCFISSRLKKTFFV